MQNSSLWLCLDGAIRQILHSYIICSNKNPLKRKPLISITYIASQHTIFSLLFLQHFRIVGGTAVDKFDLSFSLFVVWVFSHLYCDTTGFTFTDNQSYPNPTQLTEKEIPGLLVSFFGKWFNIRQRKYVRARTDNEFTFHKTRLLFLVTANNNEIDQTLIYSIRSS